MFLKCENYCICYGKNSLYFSASTLKREFTYMSYSSAEPCCELALYDTLQRLHTQWRKYFNLNFVLPYNKSESLTDVNENEV